MYIEHVVGAVLYVGDAIRAVPPQRDVPLLCVLAVGHGHTRARVAGRDFSLVKANAELLVNTCFGATQDVTARTRGRNGLELPVLVDALGRPDSGGAIFDDPEHG